MRNFSVAAAIILALAAPASAQQQMITFTVTVADAQTIINAVGQHPWNDVNVLMSKLIGQANAQLAPAAPAPPIQPPPTSEK